MLTIWQGLQALFARASGRLHTAGPDAFAPAHRREDAATAATTITVVGLLVEDRDRQLLAAVCSQNRWKVLLADTCEEARATADRLRAPLILCDRDLPGKEWREVVTTLVSTPHHACVILISKVVDGYLWNEVARIGGHDVLAKPLREDDVLRAIRLAWTYWNSTMRTTPPGYAPDLESRR